MARCSYAPGGPLALVNVSALSAERAHLFAEFCVFDAAPRSRWAGGFRRLFPAFVFPRPRLSRNLLHAVPRVILISLLVLPSLIRGVVAYRGHVAPRVFVVVLRRGGASVLSRGSCPVRQWSVLLGRRRLPGLSGAALSALVALSEPRAARRGDGRRVVRRVSGADFCRS
jgi:hypothetical protein